MSTKTRALKKQGPHGPEWTKSGKTFAPSVDILEDDKAIVVIADMPGTDQGSIDVILEENVLDIYGKVERERPEGYNLVSVEYEEGDYHRAFSLTEEVEKDGIDAVVKNGVLCLTLPKVKPVTKKIAVHAAS